MTTQEVSPNQQVHPTAKGERVGANRAPTSEVQVWGPHCRIQGRDSYAFDAPAECVVCRFASGVHAEKGRLYDVISSAAFHL